MLNYKERSDSKSRENAVGNKNKSKGWLKKVSFALLSCTLALLLLMPMLHAEELDIGPVIGGQPVRAVKPPTVNNVSIGDKTVSGKLTIGAGQRRSRKLDVTIRVIVNRQAGGTEEKTVTILHTIRSQDWTVTLDSELAEGDKVTVTQEAGGEISAGVVREAKKSLADQHKDKIKMPAGEIWIENPDANLVNKDEQAEAVEMLKKANPDIANDFSGVVFSIDGTDHAYYEVTYTDGSSSGKIEATDLKIKQVKEKSAGLTIEKVQVTDGQIIVTLDKEVAAGTKFYFVKEFKDRDANNFCEGGNCNAEKSSPQEMSQAVTVNGTTVTFPINDKVDDLKLGREFGIFVKEPHKFRSCAKSEPVITSPAKVEVRDPHKLTDAEKKAIDKAIRDANTVNGKSKLPDGTGSNVGGAPTIIDFDKDGNVTIISPNDVVVDNWDSNGNPIYTRNPDGTYKLKDGRENNVTKFQAKDLVKNIAPKSPVIAVDTNTGKVTITPPAYEKAGDDTDLASYTISYKDASGAEKTVTATRTVDEASGKTTWTADNATVDENTGVISLKVDDILVGGTVTATAKDNGGLEGDADPLASENPASKVLETATVSYNGNGSNGPAIAAVKLNKGSKYTLPKCTYNAPDDTQEFKAWEIDGQEVAAGTEITVTKDTEVKATWKDIMVDVSFKPGEGSGTMDGKTLKKGSTFKLPKSTFVAPENKKFKGWKVGNEEKSVGDEITLTGDTEIEAVWEDIMVDVSFNPGEGSGTMDGKTLKKGSKFKLPESTFTAPTNKEFDVWMVGNERKSVGDEITVTDNTEIVAVWKDKKRVTPPVTPGGTKTPDKPGSEPGKETPDNGPTKEIDGKNRQEVAAQVSRNYFAAAKKLIIVQDMAYADSMSAMNISKGRIPILYVGQDTLYDVTKEEILRTGRDEIYVMGGETTISRRLFEEIRALNHGKVTRVDGLDRFEVNKNSLKYFGDYNKVVVASGMIYTDALSSVPYAHQENAPLLLTRKDSVPEIINPALKKAESAVLSGGPNTVSENGKAAIENLVGKTVTRVDGADRYVVSSKMAAMVNNAQYAILTSGEKWSDALIAGPLAQKLMAPVLLSSRSTLPGSINAYLAGHKELKEIIIIGGPASIGKGVRSAVKALYK